MTTDLITADMKVSEIIHRYPQTFDVLRKHGCPDMRKGIMALGARVMKIRWAARVHKIPLDNLLKELNAAAKNS